MQIPKAPLKPTVFSPQTLIIYGNPKVGKTSSLAALPGCITASLEKGCEMHEMTYVPLGSYAEYKDFCESLRREKSYQFLAVDTVTVLEDLCIEEATRRYKLSNTGRNWTGTDILTELEYGAGYRALRIVFGEALDLACNAAPRTIFIAHSADKYIKDQGGKDVASAEVSLIGKCKQILCARGEIGHLRQVTRAKKSAAEKTITDGIISFKTTEELVCGSRHKHLAGKSFTFINGETGVIDWAAIYPDLFPAVEPKK